MVWNHDWLVPSTEELEGPDRKISQAAEFFRSLGSPGMCLWAVQTLADELDVPVVATRFPPMARADDLGQAWLTAIAWAGRVPGRRAELVRLAVAQIAELQEITVEVRFGGATTSPTPGSGPCWAMPDATGAT